MPHAHVRSNVGLISDEVETEKEWIVRIETVHEGYVQEQGLRTESELLDIGMLDYLPLGNLSRLHGLPDRLADLLAEELPEELVAELGLVGQESHGAGVTSLGGRQRDTGGGSLDLLSIPVLGVDTDTDELGSSDGADEVLRGLLIVGVIDLLGQIELESDVASLYGIRMGNVDVAAGEGLVEADVSPLAGKSQGKRGVNALLDRHAGDRVRLDYAVHLLLGNEESRDAEEQDEDHQALQDLLRQ